MTNRIQLILSSFILALGMNAAQAVPIVYEGNLTSGAVLDSTVNENLGSSDLWDFWTFSANAGDNITISVLRQEINHDPIMSIWFGLEADTSAYPDLFSDSTNTPLIGVFDDDQPDLFGGPFSDPLANIVIANTGIYTIAVADHTADDIDCVGECDYSIQLSGSTAVVPEPAGIALLGIGLLGLVFSRRKNI